MNYALDAGSARGKLCLAAVIVLLAAQAAPALDLAEQIDPPARPLIEDDAVVGMVIGVFKDGRRQFLAYGEVERGSKQSPDADTVYEIGSVSKVLTGVLLADLAERGRVKPDDPLAALLPDGVAPPEPVEEPITLLHLATHTSGLPRLPGNWKPADNENPYADYSLQSMHEFLGECKLRRGPGRYEYSNYGTALLGQLLAARESKSYEALLDERICRPLAMNDTRLKLDDRLRRRLAPPYTADLKPTKNWELGVFAGAGGVRSTCRDMLRFAEAGLDAVKAAEEDAGDDLDRAAGGGLDAALRRAQVKRHDMKNGRAMAFGWHIAADGVTRWHNGMTGGYHAWLAVNSEFNVGVAVLANTATMKVTQLGEQVTRIACGVSVKPPARRKEVEVDAATLQKYVGFYELTPQFGLDVTLADARLYVQATGQPKAAVFAESPKKFFYKIVDAQITFHTNDHGRVDELTLHQFGRDMKAKRKQ